MSLKSCLLKYLKNTLPTVNYPVIRLFSNAILAKVTSVTMKFAKPCFKKDTSNTYLGITGLLKETS